MPNNKPCCYNCTHFSLQLANGILCKLTKPRRYVKTINHCTKHVCKHYKYDEEYFINSGHVQYGPIINTPHKLS